jgi:hypothetical protein
MPIEYLILKDRRPPLDACPKCGDKPFAPFLRGQVKSYWRALWHRPSWCVICTACKEIVAYEAAKPEQRGMTTETIHAWTCDGCGAVYGEYVNGCPKCWANGETLSAVTIKEIAFRVIDEPREEINGLH